MQMFCDLHTHSTASDGQHSPRELAALVREAGIECWALTDHDTLDGLPEAAQAARELGLRFLPGVELSAREYPTYHILGYGFSPESPELEGLCREMKDSRYQRNLQILDFLHGKGLELSLEEALEQAGGEVLGRPHFALALLKRGYVSSTREAFDRYLDSEEYRRHVKRQRPTATRCIETIHAAGGLVSLAHPYQIGLEGTALEALVGELKEAGLDALECYYSRYTPEQRDFYLSLAKRFDLHITGGSDFHGHSVKPDVDLTPWPLETDWLPLKHA